MCALSVRVVVDGGCATRRRSDALVCAWLLRVSTDTDEHSRDACVFFVRAGERRSVRARGMTPVSPVSSSSAPAPGFDAMSALMGAAHAARVARVVAKKKRAEGREMMGEMSKQAAMPLFSLAAVTMVDQKMIGLITQSVASFIKLYLLLLFVRVLLTWFPNVNWMRQPWTMLRQVTDPYLNLFRNLLPPIMGMVDLTPIMGFMVLQFLAKVLSSDASMGKF